MIFSAYFFTCTWSWKIWIFREEKGSRRYLVRHFFLNCAFSTQAGFLSLLWLFYQFLWFASRLSEIGLCYYLLLLYSLMWTWLISFKQYAYFWKFTIDIIKYLPSLHKTSSIWRYIAVRQTWFLCSNDLHFG